MNQLLQKAFERAAELPEEEQDRFALFLLAELESERQWAELFARPESEDLLESLADEAPQTNVADVPPGFTNEGQRTRICKDGEKPMFVGIDEVLPWELTYRRQRPFDLAEAGAANGAFRIQCNARLGRPTDSHRRRIRLAWHGRARRGDPCP